MIKPDVAPFCTGTGAFWQYWMFGGVVYLVERVSREVRGIHKTFISKVIQHPSNVVEIQIKKEHTKTRAGQVNTLNKSFRRLLVADSVLSTSFSAVRRSPYGNIIHSLLPAHRKKTTYLYTFVA